MKFPFSLLHLSARLILGLLLLLGLCLTLGVSVRPAHAQTTLSINNCSSDSQLQADVAQANHDNAGDIITFACSGDLKLTSTLTITGNMTLSGSGQHVTLDGGDSLQVLSVFGTGGVSLTLNTLTIAHGSANSASIPSGGGLFNYGETVSISNSTFANNSANAGGFGGGLYNLGTMTISNSTFANNSADGGGGLLNQGTMTISNNTFANNSATYAGGGLYNEAGSLNISNSTFANNSAGSGNAETYDGGGLLNQGAVSISNSTFANNSVSGGNGGGGFANVFATAATITNSTFANNSANGGGGLFNENSPLNISGSIVAENTGGDCDNFEGTFIDNGYNLDSDNSCFSAATSKHGNPRLSPLANHGGPTQTMALLKGSPASDYIPLSSALCPKTDQRGHKRPDSPQESACDIGAYES